MNSGQGNWPATAEKCVTSGPGLPSAAAPSTSAATSGCSARYSSITALLSPMRTAICGISPLSLISSPAALLAMTSARSRASSSIVAWTAPNALKDELLHTGDPCPNRRGLTELGFAPLAASEIGSPRTLVLFGERSAELAGSALAKPARVALFDCHASALPNVVACVGLPTHVEKSGTWINVDGQRGVLGAARQPPPGVRPLTSLVPELAALLRAQPAGR